MAPDRRKLARLHRLERVRAIAKQSAAADAAQAESTLSRLRELASRTRDLAGDYASRQGIADGADLARLGHFTRGLHSIMASTEADVTRARAVADRRLAELASAERARAAVDDRAARTARDLATRALAGDGQPTPAATRKPFGTDVE